MDSPSVIERTLITLSVSRDLWYIRHFARAPWFPCNRSLTCPHGKGGSVFPPLEPGPTFITALTYRMKWKWHCVTSMVIRDMASAWLSAGVICPGNAASMLWACPGWQSLSNSQHQLPDKWGNDPRADEPSSGLPVLQPRPPILWSRQKPAPAEPCVPDLQ